MSLVTLDISEVAEVIDEAISRHTVLTRSRTNTILEDISSIHTSIQELRDRLDSFDGNNYNHDIKSIGEKLTLFESNLSSLSSGINQCAIDESNRLEEVIVDFSNKLRAFISKEDFDVFSENVHLELDTTKNNISKISSRTGEISIIKNKILEFGKNLSDLEIKLTEVITERLQEFITVNNFKNFDENLQLEIENVKNGIVEIKHWVNKVDVLDKNLIDLESKLTGIVALSEKFVFVEEFKAFVDSLQSSFDDIVPIKSRVSKFDQELTDLETRSIEIIVDKTSSLSEKLNEFVSIDDFKEFFDTTRLEFESVKSSINKISSRTGEISVVKNRVSKFDDTFTTFETKLVGLLQERILLFERKFGTYTTINDFTTFIDSIRAEVDVIRQEIRVCKEETITDVCVNIVREEIERLPTPRDGKDGSPGDPGKDGISVSLEDLKSFVEKTVSKLPIPKDGKDGEPGKDVTTDDILPLIIDFIKNELSLIKPAKDGVDGKDGKDGIGLASAMIDRDGNLFITCTNGETKSLGLVVGRDAEVDIDKITSVVLEHSKHYIENIQANLEDMIDKTVEAHPPQFDIDSIWSLVLDHIKHYESGRESILKEYVDTSISNIPPATVIDMEYIQTYITDYIDTLPKPESVTVDDILPLVVNRFNDEKENIAKILLENITVPTIDTQTIHTLVKSEIELLPKPQDGKTPSIDDISPIVKEIFVTEREGIVKSITDSISSHSSAQKNVEIEVIPDEVAEKVAKAISILAESSIVTQQQQPPPIIVNIAQPNSKVESTLNRNKKIVTRRDKDGNITGEIISTDE